MVVANYWLCNDRLYVLQYSKQYWSAGPAREKTCFYFLVVKENEFCNTDTVKVFLCWNWVEEIYHSLSIHFLLLQVNNKFVFLSNSRWIIKLQSTDDFQNKISRSHTKWTNISTALTQGEDVSSAHWITLRFPYWCTHFSWSTPNLLISSATILTNVIISDAPRRVTVFPGN